MSYSSGQQGRMAGLETTGMASAGGAGQQVLGHVRKTVRRIPDALTHQQSIIYVSAS